MIFTLLCIYSDTHESNDSMVNVGSQGSQIQRENTERLRFADHTDICTAGIAR
jgi:hypothetical protein